MSEIKVASRYAKSLIDLAIEKNALEEIKNDMELFIKTCKASTELQAVLKNPIISLDKKINILKQLFGGKVNPVTSSFFDIMVNKGRSKILYGTAKEFINQYNIHKGIIKAVVESATELSADAEKQIIATVEKATGKKVILEKRVDANLIGGFVLTVGDKQFDASILKNLKGLRKDFSTNNYVSTL
jgi:F-type H+-transporting ATPase subunit delta